eukprot:scaffold66125_cov47-Phaeocystis_antarctica.AAC.1
MRQAEEQARGLQTDGGGGGGGGGGVRHVAIKQVVDAFRNVVDAFRNEDDARRTYREVRYLVITPILTPSLT